MTAKYSTAEEYFDEMYKSVQRNKIELEVITDDLFPYEDKEGAY